MAACRGSRRNVHRQSSPRSSDRITSPTDSKPATTRPLLIAGRSGSGKTMSANVLMSRCLALGARAFVIDRAGHYEILSRLIDGAQQIEIGAEGSPYALNPWDVSDPARVPREKVAFLIALHQVMMGRLDGQQLGMLASGIRAVYGKGPRWRARRPSRSCGRSSARKPPTRRGRTRRRLRRRCGTLPTSCPSIAAKGPTPTCSTVRPRCRSTARWSSSTRARARRASCSS